MQNRRPKYNPKEPYRSQRSTDRRQRSRPRERQLPRQGRKRPVPVKYGAPLPDRFSSLLGHAGAFGHLVKWLYETDPYQTVKFSKQLDDYLEYHEFAPKYWVQRLGKLDLNLNMGFNFDYRDWSYDPSKYNYKAPLQDAGFTLCCDGGPLEAWASIGGAHAPPVCSLASGLYCGLTHQVIGGQYGTAITYPENHNGIGWRSHEIMFGPKTDGGIRMTFAQVWAKVWKRYSGGPNLNVTIKPRLETVLPYLDPYAPPEPVIRETRTGPRRANFPLPRQRPYQRPALQYSTDPRDDPRFINNPRGNLQPVLHDVLPPGPGEHEKKHNDNWRRAKKLLAALYDKTTEANDVVKAVYDALPDAHKCKGAKSMSAKANCVYNNLRYLDIDKAIRNVLKNHFEDKIYGRIYQTVGKHTPYGTMLGNRPKAPPAWAFK